MSSPEAQGVVHTFEKNSREEVRVSVEEFQGRKIINIRVFYRAESGGWLPGKQGIALAVDRYRELAEAVLKLGERLQSDGLLPGNDQPQQKTKVD